MKWLKLASSSLILLGDDYVPLQCAGKVKVKNPRRNDSAQPKMCS